MANLYDSGSIYRYIAQTSGAPGWSTPQGLKEAYKNAINVANAYSAATSKQLKNYGKQTAAPESAQFKKLVEMYKREYRNNAQHALRESTAAVNRAAAGYGNSYSKTAAEIALANAMAQRGAALPKLLEQASRALNRDKSTQAAAAKAKLAQGSVQAEAARDLSQAQLSAALKSAAAKRQAHESRQKSLAHLNKKQLELEKIWYG